VGGGRGRGKKKKDDRRRWDVVTVTTKKQLLCTERRAYYMIFAPLEPRQARGSYMSPLLLRRTDWPILETMGYRAQNGARNET
jgi:hypothetical protein